MSTAVAVGSSEDVETRSSTFLPTLVGYFYSFRVAIPLVAVRLLLREPQTGVGASLAINYALLAIVALATFGSARHSLRSMMSVPPVRWVLVFVAMTGCSLIWSKTSSMAAALAFWTAMVADLAIIVLLLRTEDQEESFQSLMRGFIWGACTFAAVAWVLPAQSDLRLGDEELLGPNQIGYACGFALFLAQNLIRRRSRFWIGPAVFLAITLLRSLSKTTIIAFVAGEAFILLRDRSVRRSTKALLVAAAVAVTVAFGGLLASYYTVYTNAGNQDETLTGRLGIWAWFLANSLNSLWIGHGFHSVWKVVPPFGPFEARHAHNEWIQQLYAYGIVGVILLAILYTSVWRFLRRLPVGPIRTLFLGLMVFILVRGLADTEPFDLSLPFWFITLMCVTLAPSIERPAPGGRFSRLQADPGTGVSQGTLT